MKHNLIADHVSRNIDSGDIRPAKVLIAPVNMMLADKDAVPPRGEVFKAKMVDRPKLSPRKYRFKGTKQDHYIKGSYPYRLVFLPKKFIRIPIDPITGEDLV